MAAVVVRRDCSPEKEVRVSKRVPVRWVAVTMVGLLLASCGVADAAPSSEELAEALLEVDDLGSGWVVEYAGPMTDEMRADPGGIDMCPEAESIVAPLSAGRQSTGDWQADWAAAVIALDWQIAVFTLPVERADAEPVSLLQMVTSGDPDEIQTIYTALSEGYRLCLSTPPPPDEAAAAAELALPEVGNERFGWVLRMGDEDRWDIRWTIVRDGAVLMSITENEILSGENVLTDQQIAGIVEMAADRLP